MSVPTRAYENKIKIGYLPNSRRQEPVMILTELELTKHGACGPWGPNGCLYLRPENITKEFYGETIYEHTHALWYVCSKTKKKFIMTRGERLLCEISGRYYVRAHMGSMPLCLEANSCGGISVRVGYRNDFRLPGLTYRNTPLPPDSILFDPLP